MKKALAAWVVCCMLVVLALPAVASATIGVGVGTGKIEIDESIKSGSIYKLPPITVFNTGDEEARYSMAVTLNETQDELKPDPAWFSFSPQQFDLKPGKSQVVIPTFHPPLRTNPGDYFAYLEANPAATVTQGSAVIGVAAATKLSFTVIPSNLFFGVLNRIISLFQLYAPWSYIMVGLIIVGLLMLIVRRYVHFDVHVSKV